MDTHTHRTCRQHSLQRTFLEHSQANKWAIIQGLSGHAHPKCFNEHSRNIPRHITHKTLWYQSWSWITWFSMFKIICTMDQRLRKTWRRVQKYWHDRYIYIVATIYHIIYPNIGDIESMHWTLLYIYISLYISVSNAMFMIENNVDKQIREPDSWHSWTPSSKSNEITDLNDWGHHFGQSKWCLAYIFW